MSHEFPPSAAALPVTKQWLPNKAHATQPTRGRRTYYRVLSLFLSSLSLSLSLAVFWQIYVSYDGGSGGSNFDVNNGVAGACAIDGDRWRRFELEEGITSSSPPPPPPRLSPPLFRPFNFGSYCHARALALGRSVGRSVSGGFSVAQSGGFGAATLYDDDDNTSPFRAELF